MQSNKNNIMSEEKSVGYLELFLGPMFSGKTSKLLEIYKQCEFCHIPVVVINHSADVRYHESMLSTHDKVMIPCIQTNNLMSLEIDTNMNEIQYLDPSVDEYSRKSRIVCNMVRTKIILINEGQFFEDLIPFVLAMLKARKKIYIGGLDGDFERKKFGSILDLIPMCDKITKLTSLCSICKDGTPGIFSLRLTKEKQQMLIGSDNYIPVCRFCYENHK